MDDFSGDKREPWTVFKALLKRYAALDNLSTLDALKEELQRFPEDMSKDEIISLLETHAFPKGLVPPTLKVGGPAPAHFIQFY